MKVRTKPMAEKTAADYGTDVKACLKMLNVGEPRKRTAGINKDEDAPIFQAADLGSDGDLLKISTEFTRKS